MKIAFVSDAVYPWNVGGLETLESTEAQELAKANDVHFFSLRWPGMEKDFRHNNIMYHTLHDITTEKFYSHGRRSIRQAIIYTIGLARIFFYKFDYIQSNEFPILQIPVLKLYCMLNGCKLILDMHEVWDKEYWTSYLGGGIRGHLANWFASTVLKMADAYIANSSVTAERLEGLGIDRSRIHTFSPVINDNELRKIRAKDSRKQVVFSGRLIKEKRVDKWLKVVKEASRGVKGMKAVLIGEGPEKSSIKGEIERLNLDRIVELRDFYHTEDKNELYRTIKGSKVLLHMSEREGLSIIVLESLALGTPVLLPEYSPIPKEVKEMCVVRDEEEIPKELGKMLESKDKGQFITNASGLNSFLASHTNEFYAALFGRLKGKAR
ncbi:MAG: glycosyltransferase [Candidatus Micrarchaeota archaeon]|nr:glycosyltransferase [Candidatus Micrarchaeota archaeon]